MLASFVEGCSSILEIYTVFFFLMLEKYSSHIPKLCVFYCSLVYWGRFWYFNCSIVDSRTPRFSDNSTSAMGEGKNTATFFPKGVC